VTRTHTYVTKRHPDDEWFDAIEIQGTDPKNEPLVSIVTAPRYKTSGLSGDEWRFSYEIWVHEKSGREMASLYGKLSTATRATFPVLYYHRAHLLEVETVGTVFKRKGKILYLAHDEGKACPLRIAAACLPWAWCIAGDESERPKDDDEFCFQPGCSAKAVSIYRLKEEFSSSGQGPLPDYGSILIRKFCQRHLRRGDCGREDSDANYEVIDGPGPDDDMGSDEFVSPSIFGGVIGGEEPKT
jgi:hypothetical protein